MFSSPFNTNTPFYTLKIKYSLVFWPTNLITSYKIDPKIYYRAETEYPKMAHSIPQYMGVTFPIQPDNDGYEKLGKHLVVNKFIAAYSAFNIQFCQWYSKTRI